MRPWLQSLDVFTPPSYANEGVPQALVQAMLCGLPSVTNLGVKKMLERMEAVFEGALVDDGSSQGNRPQTR